MIPDEFFEMVRAYRILNEVKPEQLKRLLPLAEEKTFAKGSTIFHEGDRSLFLHLLVQGEVALEMVGAEPAVRVQTLGPGDALGWSALTPGSRTHFQARALTPVTTVAFRGERLREACDRDPEIGYALMRRLLDLVTERLDATRIQLVERSGILESAVR
jgi:CRP-like cAMP-binding protein